MTCPYHSKREGKPFCRYYGEIDATKEKVYEECLGDYSKCLDKVRMIEKKRDSSREEQINDLESEIFPLEGTLF